MGDDMVELPTENDALKNGSYDQQWLEESKAKLLKQIDDEKGANLFMCRMKKTEGKTLNKWVILVITKYGNQNLITSFPKEINYKI